MDNALKAKLAPIFNDFIDDVLYEVKQHLIAQTPVRKAPPVKAAPGTKTVNMKITPQGRWTATFRDLSGQLRIMDRARKRDLALAIRKAGLTPLG